MANIIGLEWDGREVRLAYADAQGRGHVLTHAAAIAWPEETLNDEAATASAPSSSELASRIAAKLEEWNVSKAETIVAVRRAQVELRMLSVPPVPDDELPELVRFQALQQFAALGDDWPLDYLPLAKGGGEGDSLQVLAAVLPPENLRKITDVCDAVPLALHGLVLRPGATASLAQRRQMIAPNEFQLLVDLLPEEADLTILDGQRIQMMRSVRLPSAVDEDHAARQSAVLTEIRRTLAAARSQLKGELIHGIILCGRGAQQKSLVATIQEQIQLPVSHLSPLEDGASGDSASTLHMSPSLTRALPEHPERYAALVGMLLDESSCTRHAFDFKRPRRPTAPRDPRKLWTQVGLLTATTLMLILLGFWWLLAHRDTEIKDLRKQAREMDKLVAVANQQRTEVDEIDAWYRDSPNWLVELQELSERLPAADRLRLNMLQADLTAKGGGTILLKGSVDDSSTVSMLETDLRDKWHAVSGIDRDFVGDDVDYPWHFTEKITVQNRKDVVDRKSKDPATDNNQTPTPNDSSTQGGPAS